MQDNINSWKAQGDTQAMSAVTQESNTSPREQAQLLLEYCEKREKQFWVVALGLLKHSAMALLPD